MVELHDDGWTLKTLKQYFDDKSVAHEKAVEVALIELNRRLHDLNNAHQRAVDKEHDFCSKFQHDQFALQVGEEFKRIEEKFTELVKPNYQLYISTAGIVLTLMAAIYWLAVNPIKEQINSTQLKLDSHLVSDASVERELEETKNTVLKNQAILSELQKHNK